MAARKGRSWFRITTGVLMALVCLILLYQFWLFAQVVWYNYRAVSYTHLTLPTSDLV